MHSHILTFILYLFSHIHISLIPIFILTPLTIIIILSHILIPSSSPLILFIFHIIITSHITHTHTHLTCPSFLFLLTLLFFSTLFSTLLFSFLILHKYFPLNTPLMGVRRFLLLVLIILSFLFFSLPLLLFSHHSYTP
jgi:hypothetical protein